MSFDVDIVLKRGDATVQAAFRGDGDGGGDRGVAVLVGPSGIGKTSVLHAIAGLLRPDWGHVRIGGETVFDSAAGIDLAPERRRAGYVFQEPRLFPHVSVRANLLYGARGTEALAATVAMLDITALLDRWPRTLSGGEARRVAIGRALMSNPAFLLLDEPLSSLDPARREEAMRAIERVRDGAGVPILMVTHDEREAARLGGTIVRMG